MLIKDSNKLIADFLGWKKHEGYNYITPFFQNYLTVEHGFEQTPLFMEDYLLFHKDWNWLMLVVEKIQHLDNEYEVNVNFKIELMGAVELHIDHKRVFGITAFEIGTLHKAVYEAVIIFIKWYNNNNNKKEK